ncbi:MAG: MFS transporter [Janthinobacterium lividum]
MSTNTSPVLSPQGYERYLIGIAGLGGLLYGIDVGIISAALLYLGKTISLSLGQTSAIVAAVLGGSMLSSLVAGFLADWLGRKTMVIVSASLFVGSIALIVGSHGFVGLFLGRLLQGASGGVIAVVIPLYLAECLSAKSRGKGSGVFQLMLTIGIVIAAASGWYYTQHAEAAITQAAGNAALIRAAQEHAWRGMFFSVIYPGILFFAGSFFLEETPRWLFQHRSAERALVSLRRTSTEAEAMLQLREMETLQTDEGKQGSAGESLLQRRYVLPFVLACIVLVCNQTTGINSILGYLAIILRQAGMSATHATQADLLVKLMNCAMTFVAVWLVDRKGRKFLLTLGTAGIVVALLGGGLVFRSLEAKRVNVTADVQGLVHGNSLSLTPDILHGYDGTVAGAKVLTVLYSYGQGEQLATVLSDAGSEAVHIAPTAAKPDAQLQVKRAFYAPVPGESTGWIMTACLALFIASFAVGPGVVVWLALSELMPTRIRSGGMGVALLLNQGASTLIAGLFLPTVGNYGYSAMFLFWTVCTVLYFVTAKFFLPETKGKTLEEIERLFEAPGMTG